MSDIHKLLATDDTFREVADLLFGGGGDELIAKMNPTQSDLAAHDKSKRGSHCRPQCGRCRGRRSWSGAGREEDRSVPTGLLARRRRRW